MKKPANRCKCGQPAVVCHCYSTSKGHGFSAQCKGAHWGPWAKTVLGAKRLWNRDNQSSNSVHHTTSARLAPKTKDQNNAND